LQVPQTTAKDMPTLSELNPVNVCSVIIVNMRELDMQGHETCERFLERDGR
jgi:hypothetical protein